MVLRFLLIIVTIAVCNGQGNEPTNLLGLFIPQDTSGSGPAVIINATSHENLLQTIVTLDNSTTLNAFPILSNADPPLHYGPVLNTLQPSMNTGQCLKIIVKQLSIMATSYTQYVLTCLNIDVSPITNLLDPDVLLEDFFSSMHGIMKIIHDLSMVNLFQFRNCAVAGTNEALHEFPKLLSSMDCISKMRFE